MKIDTSKWGEFHLYDIFEISMGNKFDKNKMKQLNPKINFVGRGAVNNGVVCEVDSVYDKNDNIIVPYKKGDITIAMGGSVGASFIQEKDFYTSQNVCVLHTDNNNISYYVKQFIITSITASCNNYKAFVDELNRHIRKDFNIKLPITSDGKPDYKYMEEYMKKIENTVSSSLTKIQSVQNKKKEKIDVSCWKEFKVGDFFDAERGKVKGLQQKETGKIPVIAAARQNQGIAGLYNVEALFENKITISCNGVGCGSAFYHPYKFNINGDAIVLTEKVKMSDSIKQFITCILDATFIRKYSYEEKCSADKAKNEIIKLPVTSNGEPDWNYMEKYMKRIEEKTQEKLSKFYTLEN